MAQFTEEQLNELERIYGLKRVAESIEVRDGMLMRGEKVWWRCENGPELVNSEKDWYNICKFPEAYSINEPRTKVEYLD